MDNLLAKPATCGCSTDGECPAHRWVASILHDDQGWDAIPGQPDIDPADDLLDL